jgi:hypothetical protein
VTLQQAAVIGDEFWAGAVQHQSRRVSFPEEQVTAPWCLWRTHDRRASAPAITGGRAYLFRHTVLREVTYESILLRDRPGYHLQAALAGIADGWPSGRIRGAYCPAL